MFTQEIVAWLKGDHPDRADWWEYTTALYERGDYTKAYAAVRRTTGRYPELLAQGSMCVFLAQLELLANHNAAAALELLERAADLGFSRKAEYWYTRGMATWELGQHKVKL